MSKGIAQVNIIKKRDSVRTIYLIIPPVVTFILSVLLTNYFKNGINWYVSAFLMIGAFMFTCQILLIMRKPFKILNDKLQLSEKSITIIISDTKYTYRIHDLINVVISINEVDYGFHLPMTIGDIGKVGVHGGKNYVSFDVNGNKHKYYFHLPNDNAKKRLLNILFWWKKQIESITIENKNSS